MTEQQTKQAKLSPIPFRVTDKEKKEIADAANRVGLTVSAYIRAKVLEAAPSMRATRKPSVEKEELAKLLGQVGKVGGNLHQLVKRVNFKESISESDLLSTLADVRKTASAIMQTLGRKPHDH